MIRRRIEVEPTSRCGWQSSMVEDQVSAYESLARLLRDRFGNREEAKQTIELMVQANPDSAEALVRRATFVLSDNDLVSQPGDKRKELLDGAAADCEMAVQKALDLGDDDSHNLLSVSRERQADLAKHANALIIRNALNTLSVCREQQAGLPGRRKSRRAIMRNRLNCLRL